MGKFSSNKILNNKEKEKLLLELCQALTLIKDIREASQLLVDLLSNQELTMIAKRLKIAKLLLKGLTYHQIREKLNVSDNTIARINIWLFQAGSGYRLIAQRSRKLKQNINLEELEDNLRKKIVQPFSWGSLKRRYPMYFWPELLLEEIVKSANIKQRNRIKNTLKILRQSEIKSDLYKKLSKILNQH